MVVALAVGVVVVVVGIVATRLFASVFMPVGTVVSAVPVVTVSVRLVVSAPVLPVLPVSPVLIPAGAAHHAAPPSVCRQMSSMLLSDAVQATEFDGLVGPRLPPGAFPPASPGR